MKVDMPNVPSAPPIPAVAMAEAPPPYSSLYPELPLSDNVIAPRNPVFAPLDPNNLLNAATSSQAFGFQPAIHRSAKIHQAPDTLAWTHQDVPPQANYIVPVQTTVVSISTALRKLRAYSTELSCPYCGIVIRTHVTSQPNFMAYISCLLCILCGCYMGCCFIPFCCDPCNDIKHYCPNCNKYIGQYDVNV